MPKDAQLYGLQDQEDLNTDIESVVERVLDNACEVVGESFVAGAARINWPLCVYVYRRMTLPSPEKMAEWAIDAILEPLDGEYGDPDGGRTKPTQAMNVAALALAKAVAAEYVPWACEPTGEVIEITEDEAIDMCGGD